MSFGDKTCRLYKNQHRHNNMAIASWSQPI